MLRPGDAAATRPNRLLGFRQSRFVADGLGKQQIDHIG